MYSIPVPVLVVGNVTVGGTGKSPLVAHIAALLRSKGLRVGIISRGYKGQSSVWPLSVSALTTAKQVGDEAVMLYRQTSCPMAVGPDRAKTARLLLSKHQVDCIISDDGLQHYAMERDIEIAVVDEKRQLGNGMLLPAGPLRERAARLKSVDFVVGHVMAQSERSRYAYSMNLQPQAFVNIHTQQSSSLTDFVGKKVYAVAAIGHPERFFSLLQVLGLEIVGSRVFGDHHSYSREDLVFSEDLPVVMTFKDAVKCERFGNENLWYLLVLAKVSEEFDKLVFAKLSATL